MSNVIKMADLATFQLSKLDSAIKKELDFSNSLIIWGG